MNCGPEENSEPITMQDADWSQDPLAFVPEFGNSIGAQRLGAPIINIQLEARNSRAVRPNISSTQHISRCNGRAYWKVPPVSEIPASSPGGLLRGLHHSFLHAVFACPIQADLVAIGIVEIGMPPTPGHHAWQLGDVEPFLLKIAAEVVEFTDFEKHYPLARLKCISPKRWDELAARRRGEEPVLTDLTCSDSHKE